MARLSTIILAALLGVTCTMAAFHDGLLPMSHYASDRLQVEPPPRNYWSHRMAEKKMQSPRRHAANNHGTYRSVLKLLRQITQELIALRPHRADARHHDRFLDYQMPAPANYHQAPADRREGPTKYYHVPADYRRAAIDNYRAVDHRGAPASQYRAPTDPNRAPAGHHRALADHHRASVHHRRASVDHPRATVSHRQASVEHHPASIDHRRASINHHRASINHRGASADHQRGPVSDKHHQDASAAVNRPTDKLSRVQTPPPPPSSVKSFEFDIHDIAQIMGPAMTEAISLTEELKSFSRTAKTPTEPTAKIYTHASGESPESLIATHLARLTRGRHTSMTHPIMAKRVPASKLTAAMPAPTMKKAMPVSKLTPSTEHHMPEIDDVADPHPLDASQDEKAAKKPSQTCGANEVYSSCGTACPETCTGNPSMCTEQCVMGCMCQRGYVRHHGACIARSSCPQVTLY